jgi:hypothetical protein
MPRQSETIKYILDNAKPVASDQRAIRLYYKHVATKSSANYQKVAERIDGDEETYDYLLDTNFITAHPVDDCVWKALSRKRYTTSNGNTPAHV